MRIFTGVAVFVLSMLVFFDYIDPLLGADVRFVVRGLFLAGALLALDKTHSWRLRK